MIPASKSALFGRLFGWHIAGRLRATFGRITVSGLADARAALARGPVLFVVNHSTWWDPLVILHLSTDVLRIDAYAMMNAKNLERVPFFRRVGAFGVDLESPADGARGIRYAAKLLRASSPERPRAVWIFPQGEERPAHEKISARPGAAAIARVSGERAQVVAVGLRYVFAAEEQPRLAIAFGPAATARAEVSDETARQEAALTLVLARLDAGAERDDVVVLHQRQPGALARAAERMLGKIAG